MMLSFWGVLSVNVHCAQSFFVTLIFSLHTKVEFKQCRSFSFSSMQLEWNSINEIDYTNEKKDDKGNTN